MPTTHQRVNTYISNNVNTVYTNSSGTRQRILLTDMHFAGDSNYYYNGDLGYSNFVVMKRADSVTATMNSSLFYANIGYPYSLYLNFNSTLGANGTVQQANTQQVSSPYVPQVYNYFGNIYQNTPGNNMSYIAQPIFGQQSQQSAFGTCQCILYPGDTLRVGCNKYGTAYLDFLVITE
jgi:hypothetical protein